MILRYTILIEEVLVRGLLRLLEAEVGLLIRGVRRP